MQDNKSSRIFLVSSVVLGVLATVIAFAYLSNTGAETRKASLIKVMTAKRDLRDGTPIDPEKDLNEVDLEGVLTSFVTPAQKSAYKDQKLNHTVLAGSPLLLADLTAAPRIEPQGDKVVMQIPMKKGATLLIPGDWVKLLVTRPVVRTRTAGQPSAGVSSAASMTWETKPVLDKPLKVLLSNSQRSRNLRETIALSDARRGGSGESEPTVLVELTEEQATTILNETGTFTLPLTMLLCPTPKPGDTTPKSVEATPRP